MFASVLALSASASAATSTTGANSVGVSVGGAIQNNDPATVARDLDALQAAGSKWVRVDINWAQIQAGGPSSYYWEDIDRVVQGATQRGMNVLGVIAYTPGWARPAGTSATFGPDPARYAQFAATAVRHYSALGVHDYEVWNEPNIKAFWTPAPNRAAYTRLLQAAYPAIKSADPGATVLNGGTAPAPTDGTDFSPVDFLKGIYANGGGGFFDAVSHHPYSWPAQPGAPEGWSAWYQMYGTSPSLRSTMIDNGDGAKEIWATEFGAPTNGPSGSFVSETTQAAMIAKGYAEWATYDWAGPMFSYSGRDLGTSTDTRENHFGLLRNDFSPKPSYAAFQSAAGAAGGTIDPGAVPPPDESALQPEADPTDIVVKGKGKGSGKVKGKVSTATGARSARVSKNQAGRVSLRLYRNGERGWRAASKVKTMGVKGGGRFRTRLTSFRSSQLRPGTYLVRAHYLGSRETKPSTSRSRRFKIRN